MKLKGGKFLIIIVTFQTLIIMFKTNDVIYKNYFRFSYSVKEKARCFLNDVLSVVGKAQCVCLLAWLCMDVSIYEVALKTTSTNKKYFIFGIKFYNKQLFRIIGLVNSIKSVSS